MRPRRIVLVLGSAPDVQRAAAWPRSRFHAIVAINNAWQVREDWDFLVCPDDFPPHRRPGRLRDGQRLIGSADYVPANNRFGGIVYAGATMAFSAGYWALAELEPEVLAFAGCDMVYPDNGPTHFYGEGTADPLREDVTLRSLEAKSARLLLHAARAGCACVRISRGESRLVFPSAELEELEAVEALGPAAGGPLFEAARAQERRLGYQVASGRYWEEAERFRADAVDAIDALWLRAAEAAMAARGRETAARRKR